jgi:hypothetical protein
MTGTLEAGLRHAFGRWLETIHASELLRRRPGVPTLRISEDPENVRTALIWLRERPEIEVFSGFLREIRADVDANAEAILAACLGDLPAADAQAKRTALLEAVLHLSHSFVLLHELFHVLCGHADELRQARGGLALDEVHLGLSSEDGSAPPDDDAVSEAYYRELEADDTAIQWLIHAVPLDALAPVLVYPGSGRRAPRRSMGLSRGRSRVLSFRVLLVTLWLMIRLFERRRGAEIRERGARHPLPAARLLAAVATALQEFAAADSWRMEASGKKVQTLDDHHVAPMRTFFREVLKPVLLAPWPGLVVRLDDDGWETSPIWIAMESGNLLLQRPAETAPGMELERLERLRPRMMERLAAYRYINFNG